VKPVLAISAVILVLAMVLFRLHKESGLMELERCQNAVRQAKSWTVESISRPESPTFVTFTTRNRVSCPEDSEYLYRTRTHDDVITEQSTVQTHGATYVETVDGTWHQIAAPLNPEISAECGKGPAVVQQTVFNAVLEVPRRRAGKVVEGRLQTIEGAKCQEWNVDYGNEWPQTAPFAVCIDTKTHLPRRIAFGYPSAEHTFTGWNSTIVDPPAL
jgi:hypothetical protein